MGLSRLRKRWWGDERDAANTDRQAWIQAYETQAEHWKACAFLQTVGDGPTDSASVAFADLHDHLAGVTRDAPMA